MMVAVDISKPAPEAARVIRLWTPDLDLFSCLPSWFQEIPRGVRLFGVRVLGVGVICLVLEDCRFVC